MVSILPDPPAVTAGDNRTVNEGEPNDFALGSFADVAGDGPWTIRVNWGDSSSITEFSAAEPGLALSRPHTYQDNGSYTVSVDRKVVATVDGGTAVQKVPLPVSAARESEVVIVRGRVP